MFCRVRFWVGCLIFLAVSVQAQMVHQVVLLVNKNSQDSLYVANQYVQLRKIEDRNVIYLDIPESLYKATATISPEEFTKYIWKPAQAIIKKRGLDDQVLAWIYSVDFPIRVKTDASDKKQMSVCGLTFLRNKVPDLEQVKRGTYLSKLFGGPNDKVKSQLNTMAFETKKKGLGEKVKIAKEMRFLLKGLGAEMPLPNMMLGYVGENGNDVTDVIKSIRRGTFSDHRGVRSGFYFIKSNDVRSKCRDWLFDTVEKMLKSKGITATITTHFPTGAEGVMGVMMGAEKVDPSKIKSFAPGAMAEHLTSWAGEFQKNQTKMTAWIKAGATATAGTVVEPFSNPNKFPLPTFFFYYVSGSSMMESFYQSIACPLQILLLGDPLAKPYAPRIKLDFLGMDDLKKDFTFVASASIPNNPKVKFLYRFLIDGKEIQPASSEGAFYLRVANFSDGYHTLRVVAEINHFARYSTFQTKGITINLRGRSIAILPDFEQKEKHKYNIGVRLGGKEDPKKIRLVSKSRILDEKPYSLGVQLILDETKLGQGAQSLRAVAVYKDGMEVSSKPVHFGIVLNDSIEK